MSADAIEHPAFVGHGFKRFLKPVQQAVISWVLSPDITLRPAMLDLFATVDPWGLVAMGAPREEYSPEVDHLLSLGRVVSAEDVAATFRHFAGVVPTASAPAEFQGRAPECSDDDARRLAQGIARLSDPD